MLIIPCHANAQEEEEYDLMIAGTPVTSSNCGDLTVIPGVSGKVKYDKETNTLALDNATIETMDAEGYGIGIRNSIDGLTLVLVGTNKIITENSMAFTNFKEMTITGDTLIATCTNADATDSWHRGLHNRGTITLDKCTIEATGAYSGLSAGKFFFNGCNVRAKGGTKGETPEFEGGSIARLWEEPVFNGCYIMQPADAKIYSFVDAAAGGAIYWMIADAEDNVITDEVVIGTDGIILFEGFDNGTLPEGWTAEDLDKDGYTWDAAFFYNKNEGHNDSKGVIASASYIENVGALMPKNNLITPCIDGAKQIRFFVKAQEKQYFAEKYALWYQVDADPEKGVWNMVADSKETLNVGQQWLERKYDLPEGTQYVSFMHSECTDNYWICLDDVTVYGEKKLTGIETITDNSALHAVRKGTYTPAGIRVSDDWETLGKGIYIRDGKKVVK